MGIVVAGIGSVTKEKAIPSEDFDKLLSVHSTEVTSTGINCNQEYCDIVYINTGYGHTSYLPKPYRENCIEYDNETQECLNLEKIYYNNTELEEQKDKKIEDFKDRIIKRLKINEEEEKDKQEKVPKSIIEYKKEKNKTKMNTRKLLITLILGMFLISMASAYSPHALNTDWNVVINSNNATNCNVSFIQYPDHTINYLNGNMIKMGTLLIILFSLETLLTKEMFVLE